MEQNFQTSFIPKKPMVRETATPSRSISFLTIIALFVLFTVLVVTGGLYFYKSMLAKNTVTMKSNLALAKNRFEPERIKELQVLDKRLNAANQILKEHIAITPIFEALQSITMKSVRFTKFTYSFGGAENSRINVKMSGVTLGYSSLALQSDLFANNKNFIEPVFSNLALTENGNVSFDLNFSVSPSFVDYKVMLLTNEESSTNDNIPTSIPATEESSSLDLDADFNLDIEDIDLGT